MNSIRRNIFALSPFRFGRGRSPSACAILIAFSLAWSVVVISGCIGARRTDEGRPAVSVGAERLFSDEYHLVRNRRVGLVTNPSATAGGRHLADRLHEDPSVELAALFGPEHGIRGTADAGEPVEDAVDERTGVPVYSLYGDVGRPTVEMLDNIDVLIFDIQDVGAR